MSEHDIAAGLLSDLQKLDDAGRDRVLNLLRPRDLKDVIKSCLHERDKAANSFPSQLLKYKDVDHETTRSTTADDATETACRQDSGSTKRVMLATHRRDSKRIKVGEEEKHTQATVEKIFIEIESGEENEKSKNPDKGDSLTLLPNDSAQQKSFIADNDVNRPQEKLPNTFPIYLYVRKQNTYSNIEDLPVHIRAELKRRFDDMWSANQHTITQYTLYTQESAKHTADYGRIRSMLTKGGPADGPIFNEGRERDEGTCIQCIAARCPCGHFSWHKREKAFFIRLTPLPYILRRRKSWNEIGYWILLEADD